MTDYGFSTWHGRIQRPVSYPETDASVDTVLARDHAINNVNHYADIFGQVRVKWVSVSGSYLEGLNTVNGGWRQVWVSESFPISLRPDGSSYRLRVRIAGACDGSGAKAGFAVTIGSNISAYPPEQTTDATWITTLITSAAAAYLTGVSSGANAWTTMVALTSAEAAGCAARTATALSTSGEPTSVAQALVRATVWTYAEDITHPARLHGVELEEWPG